MTTTGVIDNNWLPPNLEGRKASYHKLDILLQKISTTDFESLFQSIPIVLQSQFPKDLISWMIWCSSRLQQQHLRRMGYKQVTGLTAFAEQLSALIDELGSLHGQTGKTQESTLNNARMLLNNCIDNFESVVSLLPIQDSISQKRDADEIPRRLQELSSRNKDELQGIQGQFNVLKNEVEKLLKDSEEKIQLLATTRAMREGMNSMSSGTAAQYDKAAKAWLIGGVTSIISSVFIVLLFPTGDAGLAKTLTGFTIPDGGSLPFLNPLLAIKLSAAIITLTIFAFCARNHRRNRHNAIVQHSRDNALKAAIDIGKMPNIAIESRQFAMQRACEAIFLPIPTGYSDQETSIEIPDSVARMVGSQN